MPNIRLWENENKTSLTILKVEKGFLTSVFFSL